MPPRGSAPPVRSPDRDRDRHARRGARDPGRGAAHDAGRHRRRRHHPAGRLCRRIARRRGPPSSTPSICSACRSGLGASVGWTASRWGSWRWRRTVPRPPTPGSVSACPRRTCTDRRPTWASAARLAPAPRRGVRPARRDGRRAPVRAGRGRPGTRPLARRRRPRSPTGSSTRSSDAGPERADDARLGFVERRPGSQPSPDPANARISARPIWPSMLALSREHALVHDAVALEEEHCDDRDPERPAGGRQAVELAQVGAEEVELGDDRVVGEVVPDVLVPLVRDTRCAGAGGTPGPPRPRRTPGPSARSRSAAGR